jgi:predicted AAA+ superfamily ATPase
MTFWHTALRLGEEGIDMIERREYLEKLIGYRDKNIMKVITGVRRCGKSTLLALFQDYLKKTVWMTNTSSPSILRITQTDT